MIEILVLIAAKDGSLNIFNSKKAWSALFSRLIKKSKESAAMIPNEIIFTESQPHIFACMKKMMIELAKIAK
jgi:hypothetical protein